jgi:Membrane carboxypeptidase/penicillin-binding protein
MNYGKKSTKKKINNINSNKRKYSTSVTIHIIKFVSVSLLFAIVMFTFFSFGMIKGIIDNSPDISTMEVVPVEAYSTIFDTEGNVMNILVQSGSNREPVSYEQIPQDLINAVVAIEDERFWLHNGIDLRGIMRAGFVGITNRELSEGASTITQQLIKNSVFDGGMEIVFGDKIERKLQEQYLAITLEENTSKEVILQNYLNTINLGNNTLGVQAAAKRYFNKNVSELTLSECVVIAGITQNPAKYNPITRPEDNLVRRDMIIKNMLRLGYITEADKEIILNDNVYERIQITNASYEEVDSQFSYFTDETVSQIMNDLQIKRGYTQTQAHNMLYSGGLKIYTTQDPNIQNIVDEEISNPANYQQAQYSLYYRLSVKKADGSDEHFNESDIENYVKTVTNKTNFDGLFNSADELNNTIDNFKSYIITENDTILGEQINRILQPQASFVIIDQYTGQVKAISGGRGEKTGSLTLNRASNTYRQPGSTFKVIAAFAPALDAAGANLSTVYYDEPYIVNNSKQIGNWWGINNYVGYANIREGIVYSMNVITTRCLLETVTNQLGFEYAVNFGITSMVESSAHGDINPTLALGGLYKGVSNLELTAAYAAIANQGISQKPIFYTKIVDSSGKIILENTPETHRMLKESTAFLLTDALRESATTGRNLFGTGISAPGTINNFKGMTFAGKSGTTTNNRDIWWVGYSPYYTAGIWSGYDDNQNLKSTSYHKTIWGKIMTRVHEDLTNTTFPVPDSVKQAAICRKSGKLAIEGVCNADPRGSTIYTEYFAADNIPTEVCDHHVRINVCSDSGMRPNEYCPADHHQSQVYMVVPNDNNYTNDSKYAMPHSINATCNVHGPNNELPE